ncbi:MAG: hypothetical protein VKO21_06575 [Candidatus Sericytochromatia bacterium]|nr:hypothetical protein [Candidatus Sericytochromatia bacterium]
MRPLARGFRGLPVLACLAGCDVLLLSPTMPGLVPGIGQPLRGQVFDAMTGLPLGGASVVGDVGWTTTGPDGRFELYGAVSRHILSLARAGYTSETVATGPLEDGKAYHLSPLFPSTGNLKARFATILGQVQAPGGGGAASGEVVFAGIKSGRVNQGRYAIVMDPASGLPGTVLSGVLAGGEVIDGPLEAPEAPFQFRSFGMQTIDVPFSATANPATTSLQTPLALSPVTSKVSLAYRNTSWAREVRTAVALDFGLMGSVPVARGTGTEQDLALPSVAGAKAVFEGLAVDASGARISKVTLTTNVLGQAPFDLLSPPEVVAPASGSEGVGGWPTFSWQAVPGADGYLVQVYEPGIAQPKWRGRTRGTSLAFGRFGDGDANGAALLPGVDYTWQVHALSTRVDGLAGQGIGLSADPFDPAVDPSPWLFSPSGLPGSWWPAAGKLMAPPMRPFRTRSRESVHRGLGFRR